MALSLRTLSMLVRGRVPPSDATGLVVEGSGLRATGEGWYEESEVIEPDSGMDGKVVGFDVLVRKALGIGIGIGEGGVGGRLKTTLSC